MIILQLGISRKADQRKVRINLASKSTIVCNIFESLGLSCSSVSYTQGGLFIGIITAFICNNACLLSVSLRHSLFTNVKAGWSSGVISQGATARYIIMCLLSRHGKWWRLIAAILPQEALDNGHEHFSCIHQDFRFKSECVMLIGSDLNVSMHTWV